MNKWMPCLCLLLVLFFPQKNLCLCQTTAYYDNCNTLGNWTNTGKIYPSNRTGYNWLAVEPIVPFDDHTVGGGCFYVNGNSNYLEAHSGSYILYQIISPVIDLKGYNDCRLEFWMQMYCENSNWDGGFLEWSYNGTTWVQVTDAQMCIPYDGKMSQNPRSTPFYPGLKPAWFTLRKTWTRVLVDISAFDNVKTFQLRYTFHSDEAEDNRGWAIDDIKIVSVAIPQVKGKNKVISNHDDSPSPTDDTNFGNVDIGKPTVRTFSIYNIGEAPLTLSGGPYVSVTGEGFSIVKQPTTNVISPGGSVNFDVQFSPGASGASPGLVNGIVSIPNSDIYSSCDSLNPYHFSIQASGMKKKGK